MKTLLLAMVLMGAATISAASAQTTTEQTFTSEAMVWNTSSAGFDSARTALRAYLGLGMPGASGTDTKGRVTINYQFDKLKNTLTIEIVQPDSMSDEYPLFKGRFKGWIDKAVAGK